jgi:hypothetical protein
VPEGVFCESKAEAPRNDRSMSANEAEKMPQGRMIRRNCGFHLEDLVLSENSQIHTIQPCNSGKVRH